MNKILIPFSKTMSAVCICLLLTSCHFEAQGITGSGKVVTAIRNITEDFTAIEVEKGIDVVVEQSQSKSVTVEADDNLVGHIHTTVTNGILKITSDYGNYNNVASKKVTVKMPEIKSLKTESGSNISSQGVLKSTDMDIEASSGSNITINVESDHVDCKTSSGSHITVSGKALELETASSSGSKIDAGNLLVNEVSSESSSGSATEVHPIVSLKAKASSGSSIGYLGDPQKIEKHASSGGSISNK
jgi:hypothetical protein